MSAARFKSTPRSHSVDIITAKTAHAKPMLIAMLLRRRLGRQRRYVKPEIHKIERMLGRPQRRLHAWSTVSLTMRQGTLKSMRPGLRLVLRSYATLSASQPLTFRYLWPGYLLPRLHVLSLQVLATGGSRLAVQWRPRAGATIHRRTSSAFAPVLIAMPRQSQWALQLASIRNLANSARVQRYRPLQ